MDDKVNSALRAAEGGALPSSEKRALASDQQRNKLPAVMPITRPKSPPRRWLRIPLALAVVIGGAGGGFYYWQHRQPALPVGIAFGNGRIEAEEIDIDTKFAGRISEISADAGDMGKAGQVAAGVEPRAFSASLRKSQSAVAQAQRAIDEATANVVQQTSMALLAQ